MFYASLGSTNDKVCCYVLHKDIIIDSDMLTNEFEMNASPPKLIAGSFFDYKKEMVIDMLFHY